MAPTPRCTCGGRCASAHSERLPAALREPLLALAGLVGRPRVDDVAPARQPLLELERPLRGPLRLQERRPAAAALLLAGLEPAVGAQDAALRRRRARLLADQPRDGDVHAGDAVVRIARGPVEALELRAADRRLQALDARLGAPVRRR